MKILELVQVAKQRIAEIAKQTKNTPAGRTPAIYESESGVTVSSIQNGWSTRTTTITFDRNMTKKQVLALLEEVECNAKRQW